MPSLWDIINSNLAGLIISAALGVLLASFIQWLVSSRDKREKTKKTAILLGGEIYSIQRLCEKYLQPDVISLEDVKKNLQNGKTLVVTIGDHDFPRNIYDNPGTNIGLFPDMLASAIGELYRFLDFSKDAKEKANAFSKELGEIVVRLQNYPKNSVLWAADDQKRDFAIKGFIRYYEFYMFYLGQIQRLSARAEGDIEKIPGVMAKVAKADFKVPNYDPNNEPSPNSSGEPNRLDSCFGRII